MRERYHVTRYMRRTILQNECDQQKSHMKIILKNVFLKKNHSRIFFPNISSVSCILISFRYVWCLSLFVVMLKRFVSSSYVSTLEIIGHWNMGLVNPIYFSFRRKPCISFVENNRTVVVHKCISQFDGNSSIRMIQCFSFGFRKKIFTCILFIYSITIYIFLYILQWKW